MLAQTATSLTEAVGLLGEVVVEAKLDGARVQVHRDGDEVAVFTRNLNDVGHRLPEVVAAARACRSGRSCSTARRSRSDPTDGRAVPGDHAAVRTGARRRGHPRAVPLSVRFFDVLHLDGDDVLDLPLRGRLEALRSAVPDAVRVDQLVTADLDEAQAFLRATLQAGHEGVMVKDLDAPYEAGVAAPGGARSSRSTPSTSSSSPPSGDRAAGAAGCPTSTSAAGPTTADGFVMLGKTFKGLTDEVLTWQTEQLLARETHREGHVVHVRPELVVEIALDGLVRSPRYPGGLALRFARVRGYRPDKAPHEADTLATVRALHAGELEPRSSDGPPPARVVPRLGGDWPRPTTDPGAGQDAR
jgi:DNA ligase 1